MGTLQFNSSYGLSSKFSSSRSFNHYICSKTSFSSTKLNFVNKRGKIRAVGTIPEKDQVDNEATQPEEPPSIGFAFISSVLLPDGTPDMQLREATGGQKLRDIMIDNDVELYGPYARPLLNCAGGGTCGTCIVEVIEGKELLSLKTDKEKEHLKKQPKNWRLACQITVGSANSRGMVAIQQLPEWKAHEWKYEKQVPTDEDF